jgi:uncharacterized protein YfcZ (UPF0381/DUF406 family)
MNMSEIKYETPYVAVSWGELIDKISILEIKKDKIKGVEALKNINSELNILMEVCIKQIEIKNILNTYKNELKAVNSELWEIEDKIREKENKKEFDADFIQIARMVYIKNDYRSILKRKINITLKSEIVEEKNHKLGNEK